MRASPGAAAQALLVERLEAGEPVVVGADEAEHGRGKEARRVEALRLRDVGEPVQAQLLDPRHGGVVDLARHVREPALRLRQLGLEVGLVHDGDGRELGRERLRVVDHVRVGDDRRLRHGEREVDAVAIEDAAALGGERHRLHALPDAHRLQVCLVARLELDEARADPEERERHHCEEDGQPKPDGWEWRTPARAGHGGLPRCGFTFFQSPSVVVVSPPTDGAAVAPGTCRYVGGSSGLTRPSRCDSWMIRGGEARIDVFSRCTSYSRRAELISRLETVELQLTLRQDHVEHDRADEREDGREHDERGDATGPRVRREAKRGA